MPYTKQEDRDAVKANIGKVRTPGDLNYLLTMYILDVWKKHPRYDTIHCLKRDFVIHPKDNGLLKHLRSVFADIFTVSDIYAAASCAYDEFSRRIVSKYENGKKEENGDIPEYVEAIKELDIKFGRLDVHGL